MVSNIEHRFMTDKAKNDFDILVKLKHFLKSSNEMVILYTLQSVIWDARG